MDKELEEIQKAFKELEEARNALVESLDKNGFLKTYIPSEVKSEIKSQSQD